MLLIAGEKAHSRYFSETAYENTVHVDLYDKVDVIPFDKLEAFFKEHLK